MDNSTRLHSISELEGVLASDSCRIALGNSKDDFIFKNNPRSPIVLSPAFLDGCKDEHNPFAQNRGLSFLGYARLQPEAKRCYVFVDALAPTNTSSYNNQYSMAVRPFSVFLKELESAGYTFFQATELNGAFQLRQYFDNSHSIQGNVGSGLHARSKQAQEIIRTRNELEDRFNETTGLDGKFTFFVGEQLSLDDIYNRDYEAPQIMPGINGSATETSVKHWRGE